MTYIECPNCGEEISIPDNIEQAEDYLNEMKYCPFCGYDGD